MPKQPKRTKEEVLGEIEALVRERLPEERAGGVTRFARLYYARVANDDLNERDISDLYGAAVAHWKFAHRRSEGEAKVSVFSPRFEEHGWRSTHSVIQVVTDDIPFLVDSVTMELNRHGLTIHLTVHPTMTAVRDDSGQLVDVKDPDVTPEEGLHESMIYVEIDRQTEPEVLEDIQDSLLNVLGDVRAAVDDWQAMRQRGNEILDEIERHPPPIDEEEIAEAKAFLKWINDDHFTFLGFRTYDLTGEGDTGTIRPVSGTGLGILRDKDDDAKSSKLSDLPPEARRLARAATIFNLTKANSRSTVHRPSYLDYVGVKRFDGDGKVIGEWRFLGLYTSVAYNSSPQDIPILRRKVTHVLERAGFLPASHDQKALVNILETYPRDELFHISDDRLYEIAMGILSLEERQRVRLFVWEDTFGRFLSCLVFIPRDRHNTDNRLKIEHILKEAFGGNSLDFYPRLTESVLARLHFVIRTDTGRVRSYDAEELEGRIVEAIRSWEDILHTALLEEHGEEEGNELFSKYRGAFPAAYKEDFPPRSAIYDIQRIEDSQRNAGLMMSLYRPLEAQHGELRFKLLWSKRPMALSEAVPMLENMGVDVIDERPYEVQPHEGQRVWIHDFGLRYPQEEDLELSRVRDVFQESFACTLEEGVEDDGFNRLVLAGGLTWREIVILRAYSKYLRQTGTLFSQDYMEDVLAAHPGISRRLVELFSARFEPGRDEQRAQEVDRIRDEAAESVDAVTNLDEDRILRSFLDLILATTRTNYFQDNGEGTKKDYLSFKLDPSHIPGLPLPRPQFEIFVYSPRTEAVHLRGGKVARGGIRWSDRREDFRTEVLGLMKAQMVKNAVIVPVGAKGGFVVKNPPASGGRDALMEEVVACYSTFMRGMLDITDNRVDDEIVAPKDVVRYDDDDPYLVVAADKGTATFSDTANEIAEEYDFWLGDAFASGGSQGYDHKKIGITARGAWEAVSRHLSELEIHPETDDFTVVGVGDMSGDVFGNGMLLSPHIKLVAAFNHLHIFLDPDPDAGASFKERERLFSLDRSSWSDYDPELISEGGGVYERTAKSIRLSKQVREVLGVEDEKLAPNDLIRAIFRAPVDLLFNGGIGTFVKASTETSSDVGDRTNDPLRVDAPELRCRVVGEGGNLGFTQRARIEFALAGGRINTDFIDNSAGVDCSDHEVNIKILLNSVVAEGDMSMTERNQLLRDMTDEVASLVLRDTYEQAQAISVTEARSGILLDEHVRLIRDLERAHKLNRKLEFLPDDEETEERRQQERGLTRPEIAVLLAYSKITLEAELLESDVPEDSYLSSELERYLPTPLKERFREELESHPLRREIIATYITNTMVNRAGSTFAHRLHETSGASGPLVARGFTAAREIFDMHGFWEAIENLDATVPADCQIEMLIDGSKLVERATTWLLRNNSSLDIAKTVDRFRPGVATLQEEFGELLDEERRRKFEERAEKLMADGVPDELARRVACLGSMPSALDIIEVGLDASEDVKLVGQVYFALGKHVQLAWLHDKITSLPVETHWQSLAREALEDDLFMQRRRLTARALAAGDEGSPEERVAQWLKDNEAAVKRLCDMLDDLQSAGTMDIAMLSVALREIRQMGQGPRA
ncbi:NAD-glutamate dehydrogenase [soil metagenome]